MPNNNRNSSNNKNKSFHEGKNGKRFDRRKNDSTNKTPKQDPKWYAKDEATIKNFASLPFVDVVRSPVSTVGPNPGILIIPFTPTIPGAEVDQGIANSATRAANAFYQSVAQGFSAQFSFESPDLLMLELASGMLFAKMGEIARVIGLTHYYSQNNKYWARRICEALGFDYADLISNRKEYISRFNIRADQINKQIALPKNFFICDRWRYLTSNLFLEEEPADYATCFAYVMHTVPIYNGTFYETGTCLTCEPTQSIEDWVDKNLYTVDSIFDEIDEIIASLTGDDQRNMFGAIRRVYDDGNLVKINSLSSDLIVSPVCSDIQSVQLHNSNFVTEFAGYTEEPILATPETSVICYQTSDGAIVSQYGGVYSFEAGIKFNFPDHIISLNGLPKDPEVILDITANIVPGDVPSDVEKAIKFYPRCEILHNPVLYYIDNEFTTTVYYASEDIDANSILFIQGMTRMNRHPLLYMANTDTGLPALMIGELDEYTVVSRDYMKKLHSKCAYNLLSLPENTKSVT